MARSNKKIIDIGSALLQQGKTAAGTQPSTSVLAEMPVSEMPLILSLDEVSPFPDNPRTSRNPRYDEIKESIRARGLDTVPKVTRDPERPELGYFFSDGGNTRYAILSELWQDTGEARFYRFSCVFKPWPGRLACVIGHLAENEVRGDLTFIEKALGIKQARRLFEEQFGKSVSLRELSGLLSQEGYPVHYSNISRMEDMIQYLYPYMPSLLKSGLGRPQIQLLLALRGNAYKTWDKFALGSSAECSFDAVFGEVCRHFDDPDVYSLDMFRDELIGALIKALPHPSLNYDRWLLELDPKEQNRRKHFGEPDAVVALPGHADTQETLPNGADAGLDAKGSAAPAASVVAPDDATVPLSLDSALFDTVEPEGVITDAEPTVTPSLSTVVPRTELQPDLYGAPPVLSGDADDEGEGDDRRKAAALSGNDVAVSPFPVTAFEADVAFAAVGLEPVSAIWFIPTLQDDIEHLQVMTFRLAFELAEVAGCETEIKADKAGLHAAGYALSATQPSPFIVLLLSFAGHRAADVVGCSLNEALIGSDNPADFPLLDDIHTVKLMRLLRVMRRLRELQRELPTTEQEKN